MKLGERVAITLTIEGADGARQDIPLLAEARMRSPVDDELLCTTTRALAPALGGYRRRPMAASVSAAATSSLSIVRYVRA